MDFFERQRQVRGASTRLVLLFLLAVAGITAVIDLAVIAYLRIEDPYMSTPKTVGLSVLVSTAVLLVIGGVSVGKTMLLRSGGGVKVAESLGGVRVPDLPTDPRLRRYRNVVEEIALASSTPVPVLYHLPDEAGINAFAAGYTPADAAVCVTAGSLDRLNRDELQGVIAHEFSHIVNGDMRLGLKLIGVLAGITTLAVIGRVLLGGGGRSRGNGGAGGLLALLGLVLFMVGWIGVFFARLIKAGVSRQREYLADASAVQYTRQTAGLTGALKKIGGLQAGSRLVSPQAENVSHMLFGEGRKLSMFSAIYATHPPLLKRIQVLEPQFAGGNLEQLRQHWFYYPPDGLAEDARLGFAPDAPPRAAPQRRDPSEYTAAVGSPSAASYHAGAQIRQAIPRPVADLAHNPVTAVPLIYALVFDRHPGVRRAQHGIVAARHGTQVADESWRCAAELERLDRRLRLPVAAIAFPALRNRPDSELRLVTSVLGELIRADGHVDVFEYCLGTLVSVALSEALTSAPPWRGRRQTLAGVQGAVCCLIAVLAQAGNRDPRAAAAAFQAGISVAYPGARIPLSAPPVVSALDRVWPAIDGLEGNDKATVVTAVAATILADRVVTVEESELLRTVCGVLHCPIPPAF